MAEQKFFEDFKLGEKFKIPSKTITDSHFMLFAERQGHPQNNLDILHVRSFPPASANDTKSFG